MGLPAGTLAQMEASEIRKLRQIMPDGCETFYPVYPLETSLRHLKGRCWINVDKSWTCLPQILETVRKAGVEDQVILKSNIRGQDWQKEVLEVARLAPELRYMPVFYETDEASDWIAAQGVRYFGAELVFSRDDSPLASPAYLERMREKGRRLWVNAIVFNYRSVLAAGHDDNRSLADPDAGWGWLAKRGFDIIQTDWVRHCRQYLDTLSPGDA